MTAGPASHIATERSLWREPDFLRLWVARTAATLGALMGAIQLTAILVVKAEPLHRDIGAPYRPNTRLGKIFTIRRGCSGS